MTIPVTTPDNPEILAVDDMPDNLFLLEAIFSEERYQLRCVGNGTSALEAVSNSPPSLILLDIMMPGMNGYEVVRQIRQNLQLPYIPILLITAHDNISQQEGLAAGADGLLRKPFDIPELLSRVQKLLQPDEI